uniref:Uncharacterized protein n=1 Tax=Gouania willdenowi TaxID=441366 RepID=A0A8C5E308_GOUWI
MGSGCRKIQDAWSSTIYQVVKAPTLGGVVYSTAPVDRLDQVKQVHRTALKPVLPPQDTNQEAWPQGLPANENASDDEFESGACFVGIESLLYFCMSSF